MPSSSSSMNTPTRTHHNAPLMSVRLGPCRVESRESVFFPAIHCLSPQLEQNLAAEGSFAPQKTQNLYEG